MRGTKLVTIITGDKKLQAMFSGLIACTVAIISISIVAGSWLLG